MQLFYVLTLKVEGGLKHRTFTGKGYYLIIYIIECGANSPRVTDREHLSRPRLTTDDISAIEVFHRCLEHITHLDMLFYIMCDVSFRQSELLCIHEVTLHFTVQAVPHEFKEQISITVDTWTLSLIGQLLEDILYIGHVEITAHTEVLSLPIIPAKERMDIRKATLAGSRIP